MAARGVPGFECVGGGGRQKGSCAFAFSERIDTPDVTVYNGDPFAQQGCEGFVFGLGSDFPPGIEQMPRLPKTLKNTRQIAFRDRQGHISRRLARQVNFNLCYS